MLHYGTLPPQIYIVIINCVQKLCAPLSGNRVYFGMEIQVKLYRHAVHVLKQVTNRPCGGQHFYVSQSYSVNVRNPYHCNQCTCVVLLYTWTDI